MSKDIFVLAPNGRRQKVKCTPNTTILQILEDVCKKQSLQPDKYGLKHHKHVLDLTTTIRFSNLPNKACLEMIEMVRKIEEGDVTIGLQMENGKYKATARSTMLRGSEQKHIIVFGTLGSAEPVLYTYQTTDIGERRTAEFTTNATLYDILTSLAPEEMQSYQFPTIIYMRQEIHGVEALSAKTLRQLGLINGRAVLRLFNKSLDELKSQANVSTNVSYRPKDEQKAEEDWSPQSNSIESTEQHNQSQDFKDKAKGASKDFDILKMIKQDKRKEAGPSTLDSVKEQPDPSISSEADCDAVMTRETEENDTGGKSETPSVDTSVLERRLNIENEVTFLGAQKAIAFTQQELKEELDDLPDDFYELSIEEVRKLYYGLQKQRKEMENAPLLTQDKRQDLENQTSQAKLNTYNNVVVRIQFPDQIILQGVFEPKNKIEDVLEFIKEYLNSPERAFQIITTPPQGILNPDMTLLEAKFVPCVLFHFKWDEENQDEPYLKEDIYLKKTSSDAAAFLASKYRAPSRRKLASSETSANSSSEPSTSRNSKLPKWFKT